jgi:hypothetical protein
VSDQDARQHRREVRLRWLVFGGVVAGLLLMAVVFIVIGNIAT